MKYFPVKFETKSLKIFVKTWDEKGKGRVKYMVTDWISGDEHTNRVYKCPIIKMYT